MKLITREPGSPVKRVREIKQDAISIESLAGDISVFPNEIAIKTEGLEIRVAGVHTSLKLLNEPYGLLSLFYIQKDNPPRPRENGSSVRTLAKTRDWNALSEDLVVMHIGSRVYEFTKSGQLLAQYSFDEAQRYNDERQ